MQAPTFSYETPRIPIGIKSVGATGTSKVFDVLCEDRTLSPSAQKALLNDVTIAVAVSEMPAEDVLGQAAKSYVP